MKMFDRWQDRIAMLTGGYVLLSTMWLDLSGEGMALGVIVVFGALVLISALVALERPATVAAQWSSVGFGVLLAFAPFLLGFSDRGGAAWTCWIAGPVIAIASLAAASARKSSQRKVGVHN